MSKTGLESPYRGEPRIRFLHSWKQSSTFAKASADSLLGLPAEAARSGEGWWSQSGSNRRPQACKASALPTELWPHWIKPLAMVGRVGVEPTTSRLSGVRSNHLSYRPPQSPAGLMAAGGVSQLRLHSPQPFLGSGSVSRMKGHEDGGMFFGQEEECVSSSVRHDP
jgi:hypothetical protein